MLEISKGWQIFSLVYISVCFLSYSPMNLVMGVQFWKKFWKVNIINKAKVHIWSIFLDILPSLEALASN